MSSTSFYMLIKRIVTLNVLNFLLRCNGIPPLSFYKEAQWVKYMYCILRKISVCFVNSYFIYRIMKIFQHEDITFDLFPLINSAVTACTVNSIALQYQKFKEFSLEISNQLLKYNIVLSGGSLIRLGIFYALFVTYFFVCGLVFPSNASHFFDCASNSTDSEDILHMPGLKTFTHATIFIISSSNVVVSIMLYCFICVVLRQILHSIYSDLKSLQAENVIESKCIHQFRARFLEAANMVHVADNVFSLFGLVGLACVFSRVCACIHFYLNLLKTPEVTWWFIITQISFDVSALTAICCFSASVSEEARKISPMVLLVNNKIPPKNISFHLQCLNFAKIILTQEVHMTAWKLFPFTRRVLPTVTGVTLSYITVIIQMHHATTIKRTFERF